MRYGYGRELHGISFQERSADTPLYRGTEALFSIHATRSTQAVRRKNRKPDDIRTPFSRDADRIIHTRAYTRYIDKTQVFYLVENDHITHRVIHVQLVSKIARTIGRSLRLNEDLIEAIALGHDIGHIPYGHFGESCLSALCEEHGNREVLTQCPEHPLPGPDRGPGPDHAGAGRDPLP